MVITEPNFTRPLFRCNEGALQFGSVTTKYPMCDSDRPMGVLILWAAMKRISLASMHNPICVENGGEENTPKNFYLQITVWLSPCHLRSGVLWVALFQQWKPSPQFFSKKMGGEGRGYLSLQIKMGLCFISTVKLTPLQYPGYTPNFFSLSPL